MSFSLFTELVYPLILVAALPGSIDGELTDSDAKHPERKTPMDSHDFETDIRQLLTVTLRPTGSHLDTILILTGPSGQAYQNDDAPGGEGGSMLRVITPEEGPWTATVTAYGEDSRGPYRLSIETQDVKRIMRKRGELTDDDHTLLKLGEKADIVELDITKGESYLVQQISGMFTPFLAVHVDGKIYTNSYSEALPNGSQVFFTAQADGKAKLVLTSSSPEGRGLYGMRVFQTLPGEEVETAEEPVGAEKEQAKTPEELEELEELGGLEELEELEELGEAGE